MSELPEDAKELVEGIEKIDKILEENIIEVKIPLPKQLYDELKEEAKRRGETVELLLYKMITSLALKYLREEYEVYC